MAFAALALPFELHAMTPLLSWAYGADGSGALFPVVRLVTCLAVVCLPAAALGATFPMAIRWFASESGRAARLSGTLYALNTAGAAAGALLAGFVLIPRIGISGTTLVGVAGSLVAAAAVWSVQRRTPSRNRPRARRRRPNRSAPNHATSRIAHGPDLAAAPPPARWVAAVVLGISGFASLVHEIAWTRILALVLGPTTYAFAAALAAVIAGVAIGSAAGSWMVGRTRQAGSVAGRDAGPRRRHDELHLLAGRPAIPAARRGADGGQRRPLRAVAPPGPAADRRVHRAHRRVRWRRLPTGPRAERRSQAKRDEAVRRGLCHQHDRRRLGIAGCGLPADSTPRPAGTRCSWSARA